MRSPPASLSTAASFGFETDPLVIAERASETPARVDALFKTDRPVLSILSLWLSMTVAYGEPGASNVPMELWVQLEKLGFRPRCFIAWGHPPLIIRTPVWMAPDGFVKLDVSRSFGYFLQTVLDDGQVVMTSSAPDSREVAVLLSRTGDLTRDYSEHLAAVRDYIARTGAQPLYRPNSDEIVKVWRLFYYLHVPPSLFLKTLTIHLGLLLSIYYTIEIFLW